MYKLLIVDDERNIRLGIQAMITREYPHTFEFLLANNGVSALQILKTEEIDMMLTDIKMPEMDGIRLVQAMQKLEHKPEVIIISGYDDFEYAKEAIKFQVKDYLLKPINRKELHQTIERVTADLKEVHHKMNQFDEYLANQLNYIFIHPVIKKEEIEKICVNVLADHYSGGYYVGLLKGKDAEKVTRVKAIVTKYAKEEVLCFADKDGNVVIITSTYTIFEEISSHSHENIGAIAVSDKQDQYNKLKIAYEQSSFALKSHFLFSEKTIISYSDVKHDNAADHSLPLDKLKRIANMIGTNRDQEIRAHLLEVLNLGEISKRGIKYMEGLHASIHRIILDSAIGRLGEEANEIVRRHDKVGNMYNYASFIEYYYAIEELVLLLHEYNKQLKSIYSEQKNMERAIRYIHENYHKDLNLAVVSNYVSLNYSYFSHMFKEYTGHNFVDYIKKVRVDQSKILLASPDLKIFEISHMVGYKNPKQFTRVFRELEGVSPKEFKGV
ncbi:response regulator [Lederbergia lenta]|uniref:Two-component response regulator n=1 Tax=Lederbergia lenta TaxID=1467 RepID=A0A2X4ZR82_LEDLE|nr:response regulator [Lederbergia lenta]MEC2323164.1 response regulator [Lederbergia lenta]SQI62874.1 two-component response regulator [Lederbergia lenta]